jgi:hypothetical protein
VVALAAQLRELLAPADGRRRACVVVVSAEELVSAFAGEDDGGGPARFAAEPVQRELRRIAYRLVERARDLGQQRREARRVEPEVVVRAADVSRHEVGEGALVVLVRVAAARVAEPHRERVDPRVGLRRERRHDRAVEPARQEDADRHVGHEPRADRVVERREQLVGRRIATRRRGQLRPLRLLDGERARVDAQQLARQHAPDVAEDRAAAGDVVECQVVVDRARVDFEVRAGQRAQRVDRRRVGERAARRRDEERLLAEAVAREPEDALAPVVDREREHPVDALEQTAHSPCVEALREDLGVAVRSEADAAIGELALELAVVVDLAVLEGDHLAVAREERLRAAGDVDHREASHREADVAVEVLAGAVGAARVHPLVGGAQARAIDGAAVGHDLAEDPAHGLGSQLLPRRAAQARWGERTRLRRSSRSQRRSHRLRLTALCARKSVSSVRATTNPARASRLPSVVGSNERTCCQRWNSASQPGQ